MALAGRLLGEPGWIESATRALDFVRARMVVDGRLRATCKDGRARFAAYLDDHALLGEAALALLEARWRRSDLDFAVEMAEALLERFEDREGGGFFFTAHDHEALIHRSKPYLDDSLPAGNAAACRLLSRLGHLLGETRYLEAAERALRAGWASVERVPVAHAALLDALEDHLCPPRLVVIRAGAEELARWKARAERAYSSRTAVIAIDSAEQPLPGLLGERAPRPGGAVAYVCEGTRCLAPVTSIEELDATLA